MTYAYYVRVPFQICALYRLSSEIYSLVEPEPCFLEYSKQPQNSADDW